ncbi:MAG: acyl-CoA dehydrogenase family protein [Deltaproteobacteria bacterium]|nr:acyl-CoA dehydrogenase family protein [Deltaproteobacteria bacterium]
MRGPVSRVSWCQEEYGGSGADFVYSVILTEELARVGAAGLFAPLHSDIVAPYIYHLGNEDQKQRYLPKCATGETVLAVAMTEPNAGSDLGAMKARADRDGDHYVLNGTKVFISNGVSADLVVVAARTERGSKGAKGISLLLVEAGAPGFKRGAKYRKMGMHCQDTAELVFDDCRIPAANLLGEEGKGFSALMNHLPQERILAAVMAQAMAEAMLDLTLQYTADRKAFGQPVCAFQHNAFKIVEMSTEIKLGRAFLDQVIAKHAAGADVVTDASMAKAWITEMANRVAYTCVQLHGGYGFMEEYRICRFYRDVRVLPLFAGTTEVMKLIVAKNMGLL